MHGPGNDTTLGSQTSARRARWPAVAVAIMAASVLLAGCAGRGPIVVQRIDKRSFTVGSSSHLVVQTFNGQIGATAGGAGSASVTVTARGTGASQDEATRDLANVQVDIVQSGDTITVTARRTDSLTGTNSGADVDVILPSSSTAQLTTSNGRVEAVNLIGSVTVRTSNGEVVTRAGHDVDVETSNGSLTATNASGALKLHTSNGGVDILGATDVTATVESSNGRIAFSGSLAAAGQSFTTSNGNLTLALPAAAAFSIDGQTSNGTVRSEFPVTVTKDGLSGQVGSGGATIHASTSNGDLSLTRLVP
jgi:hypothetical protein